MKKVALFMIMLFPFFVYAKEEVTFSKCVDGDTIKVKVKNKEATVRMLAVDTPESVHPKKKVEYYGKEASDYTCNLITNAKKIELEYDSNSDKYDKYERLLAWVFVDDYLLQDKLVRNGYAEVAYLYDNYKYTDLLKDHEVLAKQEHIGIWNDDAREEYNLKKNKDEDTNESLFDTLVLIIIGFIYTYIKKRFTKYLKKCKIKTDPHLKISELFLHKSKNVLRINQRQKI